jgi:glyoxylase-like metal-dependent hydrolase (beta-lactamase superfamily II)
MPRPAVFQSSGSAAATRREQPLTPGPVCPRVEASERESEFMSETRIDVIAIGSLAKNKYWREKVPARQEYATTTLVRSGEVLLIVDPGWPAEVLKSALFYRAGLEPDAVTHVYMTHMDVCHMAGIGLFPKAKWLAYDEEMKYADAELAAAAPERAVLARLQSAPDKFAPGVDLFPTFGHTPGHASVLVYSPMQTAIIAGDAVLTREHFEQGDLGDAPWDLVKAKESFQDVLEIADIIVPGHDNLFVARAIGAL